MASLIAELVDIALEAWKGLEEGKAAAQVKQDARDRADVAIDNAIAKRRLAARIALRRAEVT